MKRGDLAGFFKVPSGYNNFNITSRVMSDWKHFFIYVR